VVLFCPDPPGKPGEPECEGTTEDSITLAWEPPLKDGGKPIKGYIVEKREKGAKRWTKCVAIFASHNMSHQNLKQFLT